MSKIFFLGGGGGSLWVDYFVSNKAKCCLFWGENFLHPFDVHHFWGRFFGENFVGKKFGKIFLNEIDFTISRLKKANRCPFLSKIFSSESMSRFSDKTGGNAAHFSPKMFIKIDVLDFQIRAGGNPAHFSPKSFSSYLMS